MTLSTTIDLSTLKELIKESVREVLSEEWFSLWQSVIPEVSDAEQVDIERSSGHPSDYDKEDFVEMTEWLSDES